MTWHPSEEQQSLRAQFADLYRQLISPRVELGRGEEAFHALERSRARSFLALLASRDLSFARDIPEELDRERRRVEAAYDRLQGELASPDADRERVLLELGQVRQRRDAVHDRVRLAAPRLAALTSPEPLSLAAAGPGAGLTAPHSWAASQAFGDWQ